jgi:hypothetical protein
MAKSSLLILLLVLLAAPAGAAHTALTDDEPCNDAIAPSAPCPSGAPIQMTSIGAGLTIGAGDGFMLDFLNSDFFGIDGLVAGDIVVVSTTPLEDPPFLEDPDTVVGLFDSATIDPATERLCIGDDSFNTDLSPVSGLGSLCRFEIQTAGTYFVGITGFDADLTLFDDNHAQNGIYAVTVTVISAPEPGLMLQLAAGVIVVGALNKRRMRTKWRTERRRAAV